MIIPEVKYHGVITFLKDGKALIEDLQLIQEPKPVITTPKTLKQLWIPGAKLSFETFRNELSRYGLLTNNELVLTAKEVKGLYNFLYENKILPALTMVNAYHAFAGMFKLRFKGARSLQSIPDEDQLQERFKSIFSFFVSETNEIQMNDESGGEADI